MLLLSTVIIKNPLFLSPVSSIYIEKRREIFFILITCCWCITKVWEKAERTCSCTLNKKLRKKLLFSYSPLSINTLAKRKLFTVDNLPEERKLFTVSRSVIILGAVVHCGQCTKRKLFTVSWSIHQMRDISHCDQ